MGDLSMARTLPTSNEPLGCAYPAGTRNTRWDWQSQNRRGGLPCETLCPDSPGPTRSGLGHRRSVERGVDLDGVEEAGLRLAASRPLDVPLSRICVCWIS